MSAFRWRYLFLGLVAVCLSCGGLSKSRTETSYYTLEYGPPRPDQVNPISAVIRMERFSASPVYNTNRMIYRDEAFKYNADAYHQWRSSPADLVGYYLERDIRESGLLKAVLPRGSRFPSPYLLEGSLEDFYEQDEKDGWKAVLGLSITLMAEDEPNVSDRIVFQKTYRATEPCARRHPKALASAMSQAMAGVSRQILLDLYKALKERQ